MEYEILESRLNSDEVTIQDVMINPEIIAKKVLKIKNPNLLFMLAKKIAEYDAAFYVNKPTYNHIPK